MKRTALFGLGLLGAGLPLLIAAQAPARQHGSLAQLRPNPQATDILGSAAGPILYVDNAATNDPLNAFGIIGAVSGGPYGIGLLGFGSNASSGNLGTVGLDTGPGGYGVVGQSSYNSSSIATASTQTTGVLGLAAYGSGVVGETSNTSQANSRLAGVVGIDNTNDDGFNDGVLGTTTTGYHGVEGDATGPYSLSAIYGQYASIADASCVPRCTGSDGVLGYTDSASDGTEFVGGVTGRAYIGVLALPYDSTSFAFDAVNPANDVSEAFIDSSGDFTSQGNIHAAGTISGSNLAAVSPTSHGYYAKSYSTQAMSHVLEDENTASIANGAGVVRIDPAFTEAVGSANYQVFLTPDGDCNGLYVSEKTATSFVVRELRGGRSTLAFDYRIVAHPYGQNSERMAISSSVQAFDVSPAPVAGNVGRATGSARAMRSAKQIRALPQSKTRVTIPALNLSRLTGH